MDPPGPAGAVLSAVFPALPVCSVPPTLPVRVSEGEPSVDDGEDVVSFKFDLVVESDAGGRGWVSEVVGR